MEALKELPYLLSYADLERHLGLKRSNTSKLVMRGEFVDVVKVGVKNFFKKDDVLAWINKNTVKVS